MMDLAPYLSSIGLTQNTYAEAINDNGDIVGYGTTALGGEQDAFLLVVPEPNCFAMFGLSLAGLVLLRRRQR
jgi:hypothetical protein